MIKSEKIARYRGRKALMIAQRVLSFFVIPLLLGLCIGAVVCVYLYNKEAAKLNKFVYHEVTMEYAHPITMSSFFTQIPQDAVMVTDLNSIDTSKVGSYPVKIRVGDKDYESVLNVVDLTAPTANPVPQEFYSGKAPEAAQCVKDVYDLSGCRIEYDDPNFDFKTGGHRNVAVRLTDGYENSSVVEVPIYVKDDHTPPVIEGAKDFNLSYGKDITYRDGITVTDDFDPNPILTIDTSQVNEKTLGVYPVTYTATDECGNSSSVTINVTIVSIRSAGVTTEDDEDSIKEAYKMADKILKNIISSKDTEVQKAMNIFYWVRHHIGPSRGTSDYRSWAKAAVKGFKTRRASCYGSWACCKALLDEAGIQNICVTRYPKRAYNGKTHYWCLVNLNGGWYHCDSYPWGVAKNFWFMMTDAEILYAGGGHIFKKDIYPERSTKSVQKWVHPATGTVDPNFPYKKR